MKKIPVYIFSVCFISVAAAFIASNKITIGNTGTLNNSNIAPTEDTIEGSAKIYEKSDELSAPEDFLVLDTETDCVMRIPAKDYVIGAVAAEMPVEFKDEALKAQAVAAYTYAIRQKKISSEKNDASLHGADFSDDPSKYQAFYSEKELKNIFGNKYDEYYGKIKNAVEDVFGICIYYENEPVIAAFHSISSGKTENAKDVWGTDIPYLVSVESESDKTVSGYGSEVKMSAKDVFNKLSKLCGKQVKEDENIFSDIKRSSAGYVTSLEIDNVSLSGDDIRNAFDLRSTDFEVSFNKDTNEFIFSVKGYGHGVGMSQYGAEKMAESGSDWKEILSHYYPNTYFEKG